MARWVARGSWKPVSRPSTTRTPRSGVMTRSVQPRRGTTRPARSTALSGVGGRVGPGRPAAAIVGVGGRVAPAVEVVERGRREVEAGQPEAVGAGVQVQEGRGGSAGESEDLVGRDGGGSAGYPGAR